MKRILYLFALVSINTVAQSSLEKSNRVSQSKPNFIIILADDLGYGDLGYTGSKQIKTPHIDALAKDGVIFTEGYVSAPVCGPSRAGLMTGKKSSEFWF